MDIYVESIGICRSRSLIERLGGNPEAIAIEAGIPIPALYAEDFPVSGFSASRFLELAALRCDCRHFGLIIGEELGWQCLGEVWRIMDRCETVGSILETLERFLSIHDKASLVYLYSDEDLVTIHYDIRSGLGSAVITQAVEQAVAIGTCELRRIIGKDWSPVAVQFRHSRPDDLGPFKRIFGPNLQFDQDRNAVVIDQCSMDIKRIAKNVAVVSPVARPGAAAKPHDPDMTLDEIEKMVRSLLINAECSLANLAKIYDMNERRMQRQLTKYNDGFQSILKRIRRDLCIKYLVGSNLNIGQIAEILQFTETSVLTRFIRKECGASPREIRNNPEILGPGLFTPEIQSRTS